MLRYPAEAIGYFQQHKRRSYPKTRTDFLPPAYVRLTREVVPGTKGRHGQNHKKGRRGAEAQEKDYLIWDDELPGFGLRVFSSGKRSYVIQYRTGGRSRRYTIGLLRSLDAGDCAPRGEGATRSGRWG
jgi:hypothetical protein